MASLSFISAAKLTDLLKSTDPTKSMYVRVLSTSRLALGIDPLQPTNVIDLSKETVGTFVAHDGQPGSTSAPIDPPQVTGTKLIRRSGEYWFEIRGKRDESGSLKELLAEALKALEKIKPGTLDNLSRLKGRSRRIVARDANQLFDKPHLVKEYAEKLTSGWYYGTNNSARETNAWLQRASECAGLKWGSEFNTNLTPSIEDLA